MTMAVILFDIDGTLVDTTVPMTKAIHEALQNRARKRSVPVMGLPGMPFGSM